MHVGSRKHMWKHKHLCAVQTVDPPRNITVQHVVRNQGMQCTISTQTSRGAKTTTHAGDSRLGHFRRRFVGQRLLMATCGLGGPMNPKSKTCFRYFPTNATEDIIYIYSKKQAAPKRGYPFKSCVFIQISMAHCRKAGPCKSPCKLFSLLAPLQNPIEKTVLLICFVAIPNGAASYRRLTLVLVLCY